MLYCAQEMQELTNQNDSEDFYRDVGEESRRLTQAMAEYEKVTGVDGKKKKPVLSKDLHTWSEVLQEVENASNQYDEPDGAWGKIRKAFRKSADKADIASAWLTLLPNQSEYFSVLCGGLKLIIGVSVYTAAATSHSADKGSRQPHE